MKLVKLLIFLSISSMAWSQYVDHEIVVCKSFPEMGSYSRQLARHSKLTEYGNWDVHYYDIEFDLDIDNKVLSGKTEIHFYPTASNLESIELDLLSNMSVDSVYLNGADFELSLNGLKITLDGSYSINEAVKVGISYHGIPDRAGFEPPFFDTRLENDGRVVPVISTLSEPYGARAWWPCKDEPTDKADSVRIGITVDASLTAVANGMLTSEIDNGNGTKSWVWEHKYPIATYLVSLAITEYTYWSETFVFESGESMPLEYWMYPSYASQTNIDRWNLTSGMMETFNKAYGDYPFLTEKYGMAQFGWGGAMEHQTCSSMGSSGENTIAHELAHQWWGDLVTCTNFHHIWINEGFATYSEALYWGAKNGEAAYHSHMAGKDWDYIGSIYRNDTTEVWSIFNKIVYGKGAWTLHMLRHVMGDDPFFQTLALYRETFAYSNASTEDFQGVAEIVYGESLGWFFNQWIYGTGKPNYSWWWAANELDGTGKSEISLHVDQIQDKSTLPLFRMPIDLYFSNNEQDTTVVIWNALRSEDYAVQIDFQPTSAKLDPQAWIHKDASEVAVGVDGFNQQPNNFTLDKAYPNPFNGMVTIPYVTQSSFQGRLEIFGLNGIRVFSEDLAHDDFGEYELTWDANSVYGHHVPSGIYFVRLSSNKQTSYTQKISLLK